LAQSVSTFLQLAVAPAIYWYIATGDLNEAVGRASPIDVVDEDLLVGSIMEI